MTHHQNPDGGEAKSHTQTLKRTLNFTVFD